MEIYFITGSSKGLGKALAQLCVDKGHEVTGFSREDTWQHAAFRHVSIDLSTSQSLESFRFPALEEGKYEKVVLINNAATEQPLKHLGNAENIDIIRNFTLNLVSVAVLTNAFVKAYRHIGAEKIVINLSSGAARIPIDGMAAYCSSKAGLEMLTKVALREQEIENSGFRFAAIEPGIVDTGMQTRIRHADKKDFSRLQDFISYKEEEQLIFPLEAAEKIYSAIKNLKSTQDAVFPIKS